MNCPASTRTQTAAWQAFEDSLETLFHSIIMFDRDDALSLDRFERSGADRLEVYMAYIQDGETIATRLHKLYGPESNDLSLQLRKRGINKAVLAGMPADLCVEAPKGELLEQGIEVVVVKDTTPAAKLPEGDGYQTALVNFRFMQMPSIAQMTLLRP